jgi:hypothetical protein
MSFNQSRAKLHKVTQSSGWEEVIQEAKRQLAALEARKVGLLSVIAKFERMRDAGELWPGDNKVITEAKSVPA